MSWHLVGEETLSWEWQDFPGVFGPKYIFRLTQLYTQPHPGKVLFSLQNSEGEFLKIFSLYPLPPVRIIEIEVPEELYSFLVPNPVARLSPWSRVYDLNDWKLRVEEWYP